MHWFYLAEINGERIQLGETESHHAIRVLRLNKDERVMVTDGKGLVAEGVILDPDPKALGLRLEHQEQRELPSWGVHLGIAPTKASDRMEWLVEKATECGVRRITPLRCTRSERKALKTERLKKISLSAMKQSRQCHLPRIDELTSFGRFLEEGSYGQRFLAWCSGSSRDPYLGKEIRPGEQVRILIGPEGDFTNEEVEEAIRAGYRPVSLGPSIYRTETAGLLACHLVQVINETAGD